MFVGVCRSYFLNDLSCRFYVTSIICPLDVLSVDVLSVSPKIDVLGPDRGKINIYECNFQQVNLTPNGGVSSTVI